ncbi:MAG: hypothetical protein WCV63_00040 [Negativicutes bacterium]
MSKDNYGSEEYIADNKVERPVLRIISTMIILMMVLISFSNCLFLLINTLGYGSFKSIFPVLWPVDIVGAIGKILLSAPQGEFSGVHYEVSAIRVVVMAVLSLFSVVGVFFVKKLRPVAEVILGFWSLYLALSSIAAGTMSKTIAYEMSSSKWNFMPNIYGLIVIAFIVIGIILFSFAGLILLKNAYESHWKTYIRKYKIAKIRK